MTNAPGPTGRPGGAPRASPVAPVVVLAALIIAAALAYKALQFFQPPSSIPSPRLEVGSAQNSASSAPINSSREPASPDPAVDVKQLLVTLADLDGKEPITVVNANKWKESLRQLVLQGAAGVPTIQQFLAFNVDANYAGVSGADQLGFNSLRSALLDALEQIGLPESTSAMLNTLQTSIFPTDIATISRMLNAQDAEKYQPQILAAVRRQLSLAAVGQLGGADVGPLYKVMADEGAHGGSVAADLAQYASKWTYYSIIALADLPDNSGVPLLVQIAQGRLPGNQVVAVQALAELAPQNSDASNVLFGIAIGGQLDDSTLAQVAPFLAGRQYELNRPSKGVPKTGYSVFHVTSGNQDYSTFEAGAALSGTQLLQRIYMIDRLLAVIPPNDTVAQDAFQQQKAAMSAKLPLH